MISPSPGITAAILYFFEEEEEEEEEEGVEESVIFSVNTREDELFN